jgi:hypothetical protein
LSRSALTPWIEQAVGSAWSFILGPPILPARTSVAGQAARLAGKEAGPYDGQVGKRRQLSVRTLLAMLGMALSLVYAGSAMASAVNLAEHSLGGAHASTHLPFSSIASDNHEHGDHPDDAAPDASHNHADAPAGVVTATVQLSSVSIGLAPLRSLEPKVRMPRAEIRGPDRPPKAVRTTA